MKRLYFILMMILPALLPAKPSDSIDIDFTRDSEYWINKFPALSWNTAGTDYMVGSLNNYIINNYSFKGSFGKFNPGSGVYAQPVDIEDNCRQYIWAFRIANSGNSYITFPEVSSAGQLTIHCKSGNSVEQAIFYIDQLISGQWVPLSTMIAPPHGNMDLDFVLRENLNISTPVKLRISGASKNLHVYSIKLKEFDINTLTTPLISNSFDILLLGNVLKINSPAEEKISILIYDAIGRLIFSRKNTDGSIVLPDLKGFYFVSANNGKEIITKKIIIL